MGEKEKNGRKFIWSWEKRRKNRGNLGENGIRGGATTTHSVHKSFRRVLLRPYLRYRPENFCADSWNPPTRISRKKIMILERARTSCFENDKKVLESPETSRKLKKKFQKFFYPYNRKNLEKFCENFVPKIFLSFFSVITENFFFNFLDVSGDSKTFLIS